MQFNERLCQNVLKTCKIEDEKTFFYKIGVNLIEVLSTGHTNMLG
jgi:hypothetical protein